MTQPTGCLRPADEPRLRPDRQGRPVRAFGRRASCPRRRIQQFSSDKTEPVDTHPPMTQDDPNVIPPGRDPTTFTGAAISPGVGMGPAWLVVDLLESPPDPAAIARDQIAGEWSRILTSFEQTRRELEDAALRIEEQFDAALASIFRAHGMMLDGILSSGEIERELGSLVGAEAAVRRVFRRLHERFKALKAPTLQQRADDVAELAIDNGADGVGLFRIEQLYLARTLPPSEDELFEELRALTAPLRGRPVTIRLLDVGGDKPVPFLPHPVEPNPSLGRRGVRLLLGYPQLARTQLAALVRLAQEQDVRILVPMVTLEADIREMRALFDATLATFPGAKRPPFGAMIETLAAALDVATIARHVDFLSVGTNDLAQYTLAAGRDDPAVSHYYDDTHAAVLRLLAIAITDAPGVPIALCGELAGREETMPQLLRLGFRSLSMAPGLIPGAKELIRGLRLGEG